MSYCYDYANHAASQRKLCDSITLSMCVLILAICIHRDFSRTRPDTFNLRLPQPAARAESLARLLSRGGVLPEVISIDSKSGVVQALATAVEIHPRLLEELKSLSHRSFARYEEDIRDAKCLRRLVVQSELKNLVRLDLYLHSHGADSLHGILQGLGEGHCPKLQQLSIDTDAIRVQADFQQAFVRRGQDAAPLQSLKLVFEEELADDLTPLDLLVGPSLGQLECLHLQVAKAELVVATYLLDGPEKPKLKDLVVRGVSADRDEDIGNDGCMSLFSALAEGMAWASL